MIRASFSWASWMVLLSLSVATAAEPIRLASTPSLSPDGSQLVFSWNGDIWTVPSMGGKARPLTLHPAKDREPHFSPDGKEIAFVSDREGSYQVYTMPATGGQPQRVTTHSAGYTLHGYTPDGKQLLVASQRDHMWRHAERFFLVDRFQRGIEQLLFDDYGHSGTLSPDGKKLLFCREGVSGQWWRKGYHGSQAGQIWVYDRESKRFEWLINDAFGGLWPMWKPDGKGFYFVSGKSGVYNLAEYQFESRQVRELTRFKDDSVVFPAISRDGSTIVFRHLFDLYLYRPGKDDTPIKLDIVREDDRPNERIERKVVTSATAVDFTSDGLEIAFVAGGDLWVMDTELREPKRITRTGGEERSPLFTPDGQSLLFISDASGEPEIWRAQKAQPKKFWWQNDRFVLEKLTADGEAKAALRFSPDGKKLAYLRSRGDLWVSDPDGKNARKVIASWNALSYDWSPDGKWLVYAQSDNDFNREVFVVPLDGSRPAVNLSRHPYIDDAPVWSPDGKVIAWKGTRQMGDSSSKTQISYVYLQAEDGEKTARDRSLEKAIEKMLKGRTPSGSPTPTPSNLLRPSEPAPKPMTEPKTGDETAFDPTAEANTNDETAFDEPPAPKKPDAPAKKDDPLAAKKPDAPASKKDEPAPEVKIDKEKASSRSGEVRIDFDRIEERIRKIPLGANDSVGTLFWSPDSKKLAFTGSIDGASGTYTIDLPEDVKPKQLTPATGSEPRWLKQGNQIVWLSNGLPASVSATPRLTPTPTPTVPTLPSTLGRRSSSSGTTATPTATTEGGYRFQVFQEVDLNEKYAAAFDLCWRTMRDQYYDDRLGNKDWNAVRSKYRAMAAASVDLDMFAVVVNLMLGELNGSHLGFLPGVSSRPTGPSEPPTISGTTWRSSTGHLGIRFVTNGPAKGKGLKVRDVIPGGPADQKRIGIRPGDVVTHIDGQEVGPDSDLGTILSGVLPRDVVVKFTPAAGGKEKEVIIRPTTYTQIRSLLYEAWMKANREQVNRLSNGTLGYLHISGMNFPSFYRFEEELFSVGAGKEGLIIDVRENGGGSTADVLLTALTQPVHAIAVPRGGGPGYPQDRKVYATWNKPIVVLCNQNSFSNAEIFSHAIKTLDRGKLVGVPTAGGVISTAGTAIMDVGFLRLPFRGWYLIHDGEDMELNGAKPDVVLWPMPGELPAGKDRQLEKAVEQLLADVQQWKAQPRPKLHKAMERELEMRR